MASIVPYYVKMQYTLVIVKEPLIYVWVPKMILSIFVPILFQEILCMQKQNTIKNLNFFHYIFIN